MNRTIATAALGAATAALGALLVTACERTDKHAQVPATQEAQPSSAHTHATDAHDPKGPIGHRFESAQHWAPHFDNPERDAWQKPEHVVSLLGLQPGHVVADIGAGTGYFLPHLAHAVGPGGVVVGIDIEPDMVRHMRERAKREGLGNVRAQQGKPQDAGLEPASTDRILIVNTWHHIPDRIVYAGKLAAALRPNGAVFVVDYTLDSPYGPPKDHRLPPRRVLEELEEGGLDARLLQESLPRQYVVAGKKR